MTIVDEVEPGVPVIPDSVSFVCKNCNKSFSMLSHLKIHACVQEIYHCDLCKDEVFTNQDDLKEHLKSHAAKLFGDAETPSANNVQQTPSSTTDISDTQCEICGKTYARKEYLKRHRLLHTADKSFPCEACGKVFAQKRYLTKHAKTHTNETAAAFNCKECGKNYTREYLYKAHVLSHSKTAATTTHGCTECGKTFAQKYTLARHMKTHTK